MSDVHSDALVLFGATGDLAYKEIFPSLQGMVKRGTLNVPVIGVAKVGTLINSAHGNYCRARKGSCRGVTDFQHIPAVGHKSGRHVFGEGDSRVSLDRNVSR